MYWKQMTTNLGVTKPFSKINIVFLCSSWVFIVSIFVWKCNFYKNTVSNNQITKNN